MIVSKKGARLTPEERRLVVLNNDYEEYINKYIKRIAHLYYTKEEKTKIIDCATLDFLAKNRAKSKDISYSYKNFLKKA